MPNEDVIRDLLSQNLEVLEPGLKLVETNHKLPNDAGAKGFVDILARDKFGHLVIIELKRSDQAARQALLEILKYMRLFRQHHGIQPHNIRCFIVSTTWHELLVPFTEFRELCETQTEGFRITVDGKGNILTSQKVSDHIEAAAAKAFRVHGNYLYRDAKVRDESVRLIQAACTASGAEGHLVLRIDYRGDSPAVIYPHAAYLVPTRVGDAQMEQLLRTAAEEMDCRDGEEPDLAALRDCVEQCFQAAVVERLREHYMATEMTFESSGPEVFTAITEGGWAVAGIERTGPFASALVLPDADIIAVVKGVEGDNAVRYARFTSPTHKLDWKQVQAGAQNSLRGNPTWEAGFAWFLDRVEREFADGMVLLQIYNPLLLPESLYRFAVEDDPDYVPMLSLTVLSQDGKRQQALVGTLVWDGKKVPQSVDEVFVGERCGSVPDYYLIKTVGGAWEMDQELVQRHGLEYGLFWLTFGKFKVEESRRMVVTDDGAVEEVTEQVKLDSLTDYFEAARPYLEALFTQIDAHVGRA